MAAGRSLSSGGSSNNSSSSSSGGGGPASTQQDEELRRTLRLLLQRGRAEAAVHILQQEYTASGRRLKDEALRCGLCSCCVCLVVPPAAWNC